MKDINVQATNKMNLVGKLMNVDFGEGKLSDGREYKRATVTIRVNQPVDGKEEMSEIPIGFFATPYTSTGKQNPAYKSLVELRDLKTAQNVGIDAADQVRITSGVLSENNFVSRSGNLINGFQIRGSFISSAKLSDIASFTTEIFIMDMHDEVDKEGDPTGRLIVRGGIVQYGGKLDVLDFVVEAPDKVEFVSRNWEPNTTQLVKGRVRVTSHEVSTGGGTGSWGEDLPDTTTTYVRELVITGGEDTAKDEDFSYDPVEIKKAFNQRKAMIEQMQIDARSRTKNQGGSGSNSDSKKYEWE
jgi:hypothetical protein